MESPRKAPQEQTDVTRVIHTTEYPAILPSRPELNQVGKTVLITGGSSGIGLATAEAFIVAGAAKIIIVSRRAERVAKAAEQLRTHAKGVGKQTIIVGQACDVASDASVNELWSGFEKEGTVVDVLVLGAAKFTQPKTLFDLGLTELWSEFEVNVRAPFHLASKFHKQPGPKGRKVLINISTVSINTFYEYQNPDAAARPGYSLTKNAGTLAAQLIAKDVCPDELQVINFHPGLVYTGVWEEAGIPPDALPFDDISLAASFTVWAASEEAKFLHGRFVWASWDVTEMMAGEFRQRVEKDKLYLTLGIHGLDSGVNRA